MKAIVYTEFGPPDVLRYEDVGIPAPAGGEVLVRVRAASINPLDHHFMTGTPKIARLFIGGLREPKSTRFGGDVSGVVEAVGANVTRFKPGDAVFGTSRTSYAEYTCAPEAALAIKPEAISFEDAAAIPIAGLTAFQALRNKGHVQPAMKVLVNGAAGGVGTFAVQFARAFGAAVAGVCSTRNVELVRSLGAERVYDYTREDFTKSGERYDVLLDNISNHSFAACRRVMTPKGVYLAIGTTKSGPLDPLPSILAKLVMKPFVSQQMPFFMARRNADDLAAIAQLIESGQVRVVIDRQYSLRDLPQAMRYFGEGHARGKVVITVP